MDDEYRVPAAVGYVVAPGDAGAGARTTHVTLLGFYCDGNLRLMGRPRDNFKHLGNQAASICRGHFLLSQK